MNTKALAVMAVMAMVFAGAGFAFATPADADPVTYDFKVAYDGLITDEDTLAVIGAMGGTISYQAQLVDDLEERITILNLKYYEALEDGGYIVGNYVCFADADLANTNVKNGIKEFTYAEFSKTGKLVGGVSTIITFADVLPESFGGDYTMNLLTVQDKDEAVAVAVIETTALLEEFYKDYKSPAQVEQIVADAVAVVEAKYADYLSPAQVQEAVDKAVAIVTEEKDAIIDELNEYIDELEEGAGEVIKNLKAKVAELEAQVEEDKKVIDAKDTQIAEQQKVIDADKKTIAQNKDKLTIALAVAIVLGVLVVALGGFTVFKMVKANKAKKAIEQEKA